MSKKVYNKLVRDKIPDIIRADGKVAKTRILGDEEYLKELIRKVSEELAELEAEPSAEELADLYEVLLGLADTLGVSRDELEKTRADKAAKRGAFKDKVFLEEVE